MSGVRIGDGEKVLLLFAAATAIRAAGTSPMPSTSGGARPGT